MKTKLKRFRVDAGLTQANVANAVGVSQPNYQRWEAGSAPIPDDKLKKLAKVLKTTPEGILGRHPPVKAGLYNKSVGEDLNYYGEVSIQFCGGGDPLLLSISDGAYRRMYDDLQRDVGFVTVESLANQTVIIRKKAIADLYFSSEAYGYCGPDEKVFRHYPDHINIQMPDTRDWEIVEALAADGVGLEDFDPADVDRVTQQVMITAEQYQELVANGTIKPEDLEGEREKNQKETDLIFTIATRTTYQLSSGERRSVYVDGPEEVFRAFSELPELEEDDLTARMILLRAEGWHRSIFINKDALDYVSIPTHRYIEGRTEVDAEDLEAVESARKSTKSRASAQKG